MNMMKIEEVVGDVILVILENYDPLKKIGIKSDKIFVRKTWKLINNHVTGLRWIKYFVKEI